MRAITIPVRFMQEYQSNVFSSLAGMFALFFLSLAGVVHGEGDEIHKKI
jgi:hypothetical protein